MSGLSTTPLLQNLACKWVLNFSVFQPYRSELCEATVNAAYALARPDERNCDPKQTLVLCERDWGAQEVRNLNAGFQAHRVTMSLLCVSCVLPFRCVLRAGLRLQVLSAAEIIDDLLREDAPSEVCTCREHRVQRQQDAPRKYEPLAGPTVWLAALVSGEFGFRS